MGWDLFGGVSCVVQGRRRLGMMKRNGAELMRKWKERRRMCGRWTKWSRRIFMRLLKEVRKGEEELNVVGKHSGGRKLVLLIFLNVGVSSSVLEDLAGC
jgi:hypothetical protein